MSKIIENYEFNNLTKDICNKLVESTHNYKFELNCSDLFNKDSILPELLIDLKNYGLHNKSIKNLKITIKSKKENNKSVISDVVIDKYLSGSIYELCIDYRNKSIYNDKFVNGQDIIVSDLIIFMSCLTSSKTEIKLKNIYKLESIIDLIVLEIDVNYVKFYDFLENLLEYSKNDENNYKIGCIDMDFEHYNSQNLLRFHINNNFCAVSYNINEKKCIKDESNLEKIKINNTNTEKITKDILIDSIISTHNYKLELNCSEIFKLDFAEPLLVLNLKNYNLNNKSIKNCFIKIKSKIINGQVAILADTLDSLLHGLTFKIKVDDYIIFNSNFVNGQDIILSDFILLLNCLSNSNVNLIIKNIYKLVNFIDLIDFEVNVNYVKFNNELENKINTKNIDSIVQKYNYNDYYNIFFINTNLEMGGIVNLNGYTKEEFYQRYNPNKNNYNDKNKINLIEKSKGTPIKLYNLDGFKLNKYEDEFILNKDGDYIITKYDFVTWKNKIEVPLSKIIYHKIIEESNWINCYKIDIRGYYDCLTNLCFNIPEINFSSFNKDDICFEFIDYNFNIIDLDKMPLNITIKDSTININLLNNNLLFTYSGISFFNIKIKSNHIEQLIKSSILMEANFYGFKTSYISKYIDYQNKNIYYYIDPLSFAKL